MTAHFTVVCLVTWHLSGSEARVDFALMKTFLLFTCKASCSSANKFVGDRGAGGVGEAGVEGAGSSIPKVTESRRNRGILRNLAQYFAMEKSAKRREPTNTGREPGSLYPPVSPPPPS